MLAVLKKQWPLESLILKMLTYKLAMLMALSSQRAQTLQILDIKHISRINDEVTFENTGLNNLDLDSDYNHCALNHFILNYRCVLFKL